MCIYFSYESFVGDSYMGGWKPRRHPCLGFISRNPCYPVWLLDYILLKFIHQSKPPVLQNVTGFGDTVFKEVIKLRLLRWFLIQDDCYPYCCCCLVTKSCPSLCIPMDCNIPGFPVLHCLPKFAQTHVHWVRDAIQPFHPLSSPSPPAFNLSQHQSLFQWVGSLNQVGRVLELQIWHHSFNFQWIFRVDFL